MKWHVPITLLALCPTLSTAALWPPVSEVGIRIPELVGTSSFVCKGEVTSAPEPKLINGRLPRNTGIAIIRIDICFKGGLEGGVRVASDEYLPAGGWGGGGHVFMPKVGEYGLLFLNKKDDRLNLADQNRGALPVSRLASKKERVSDALESMEQDFNAGLDDPDPELVLKSVLWLGCLEHLHSAARLHRLLERGTPLERLYVWEALLKTGDLSVVGDAARYLDQNPPVSRHFFLPADRLPQMGGRVFMALCAVRDPSVIPFLDHFLESPDPNIRVRALMGLRTIGSFKSARVFLRELYDHHENMDFIAKQALFELAGGGAIDWVPTSDAFQANADYYANRCRDWWRAEGEAKARTRLKTTISIPTQ